MSIQWAYFPRSEAAPAIVEPILSAFEQVCDEIDSTTHDHLPSNDVLAIVRPRLEEIGFTVETGKKAIEKIKIPVLFGNNGVAAQSFEADALHPAVRMVLEVEAGRAVTNYQFLKDYFEACVMVDVDYLTIAVRNLYRTSKDFDRVVRFFDTLHSSSR